MYILPLWAPGALVARARPPVYAVAFSPDGKTLATGDAEGRVRLWEAWASPAGKQTRQVWPPEVCRMNDAEPDRGRTLTLLGAGSVVSAVVGIFLFGPGEVAVVVGWRVWRLAERDLAEMRQGRRDAAGRSRTLRAMGLGMVGLALGFLTSAVGFFSPLNRLLLRAIGVDWWPVQV